MTQEQPLCRFCHDTTNEKKNPLLEPCQCRGSLQHVHALCLSRWRRMNPVRNANMCLLCFSPYTFGFEDSLETIPDLQKMPIFFLRYPFFLCITVNYVGIVHATLISNPRRLNQTFELYQYTYQSIYLLLFLLHWKVRNKRLYLKYWSDVSSIVIMMCLVASNVFMDDLGYLSTVPISFALSLIYTKHLHILHDMNCR